MNTLAARLESLLWHDPARRGPAAAAAAGKLPAAGHLGRAAASLLQARTALLFTGFPVCREPGAPVPETDGPPGTLLLAWALQHLGARPRIVTDPWACPLLQLGLELLGLAADCLHPVPSPSSQSAAATSPPPWAGAEVTHLVAIERPGPSHHRQSLADWGFSPAEQHAWIQQMGLGAQDRCFNMRGERIDWYCAGPARLFEHLQRTLPEVTTVGVLDGGNELGAGGFHPRALAGALGSEVAPRILCRVPCRHVLVCGTSNWGGYALGLLVAQAAGALDHWPGEEFLHQFLNQAIERGLCVDGVTGRAEPTVDGRPLAEERQMLGRLGRTVRNG